MENYVDWLKNGVFHSEKHVDKAVDLQMHIFQQKISFEILSTAACDYQHGLWIKIIWVIF
ncbi:hypothetical protein [Peptoclostridium litorale]|uniref:hypothetical protein n=1 Tax=Peptoclostridium litorale TaxID=1557 RepID=UPI00057150BC|nr:hypothetical protein [Peptoclostridium litorale]